MNDREKYEYERDRGKSFIVQMFGMTAGLLFSAYSMTEDDLVAELRKQMEGARRGLEVARGGGKMSDVLKALGE